MSLLLSKKAGFFRKKAEYSFLDSIFFPLFFGFFSSFHYYEQNSTRCFIVWKKDEWDDIRKSNDTNKRKEIIIKQSTKKIEK
jgi:hypothetical protein